MTRGDNNLPVNATQAGIAAARRPDSAARPLKLKPPAIVSAQARGHGVHNGTGTVTVGQSQRREFKFKFNSESRKRGARHSTEHSRAPALRAGDSFCV